MIINYLHVDFHVILLKHINISIFSLFWVFIGTPMGLYITFLYEPTQNSFLLFRTSFILYPRPLYTAQVKLCFFSLFWVPIETPWDLQGSLDRFFVWSFKQFISIVLNLLHTISGASNDKCNFIIFLYFGLLYGPLGPPRGPLIGFLCKDLHSIHYC